MVPSIDSANFKDKKVLLRVDYNVPLDKDYNITDDLRIRESLPTIDKIIDDHGIPIVMSHLGRPKGKRVDSLSLKPVAEYLIDHFGYNVRFVNDCIGQEADAAVKCAAPGEVILLENLRFHPGESANDVEFAEKLSYLGDAYVNDAFATLHRKNASIYELPKLFEEKYAGLSVIWELDYFNNMLARPQKPYSAIVGGAKVSDKISFIRSLIEKTDTILIGGGMMFTFLKANGIEIGNSICETDKIDLAKELIEYAEAKNVKLLLPSDVIIADKFDNNANIKAVDVVEIPEGWMGMDIGPKTIKMFGDEISKSRTVIWNGPMGVFEMSNFSKGTDMIAGELAKATSKGAITVVGGGDSAAAIKKLNYDSKVTHVSPGGGAWLKFMEGSGLPGIEALEM